MPSTWLAFDRIRAYARANRIYQHERIFQDQSQLDRITAGAEFLDWSQQAAILDQTNLQINRMQRYKDYDMMDQTGCVSLALDLYADESSLVDPERKHTLVIRARSRRLKKELEELFFQTLQWDSQCRPCIRYLCKFGDCPYEIVPTRNRDGVSSIRHMNIYNFTRVETRYGDLVGFFYQDDLIPEPVFLHPWQVMHLRLSSLENIFAPYGRCMAFGSRVNTPAGFKNIEDLVAGDQVLCLEDNVATRATVVAACHSGKKRIFRISTKHFSIDCSGNHPVMVRNWIKRKFKFGEKWFAELTYKRADEITLGDELVAPRVWSDTENVEIPVVGTLVKQDCFVTNISEDLGSRHNTKRIMLPSVIDKQFARMFGFMVGDGWITKPNDQMTGLAFALGVDEEINSKYEEIFRSYGLNPTRIKISDSKSALENDQCLIKSKDMALVMSELGFTSGAKAKRLPKWVYGLSLDLMSEIVNGLVDSDGSTHLDEWGCERYQIELSNKELVRDIKTLLHLIGWKCGSVILRKRQTDKTVIHGKEYIRAKSWIIYFYKSGLFDNAGKCGQYPGPKSRQKECAKFGSDLLFEPVIKIVDGGIQETADIQIDRRVSNFVVNGVVVHNSILDGGRKAFKQLRLMEDAALIYRITRAPEKRMFKIPVGNIPAKEVPEYMEIIARKFKRQRFYNPSTGTFDERYSPLIQEDDFLLPQRCLPQYTEVALLNGSTKTLGELRETYGAAGRFWVYSYDLTNKRFVPKQAKCVVGPKRSQIIRLTLDDGSIIDSTPDHRHYRSDGTEVRADNIKINDSLLSLYRRKEKLRPGKNIGDYEQILDPFTGDWEFTHRLVMPECPTGYVRHHVDFNRFNNIPNNLELMTVTGHKDLHALHGHEIMRRLHDDLAMKEKFLLGTERGIKTYNNSERAKREHQEIRAPHVRNKWKDGDYDHTIGKNHVQYVDLDAHKETFRRLLIENSGIIRRAVSAWNADTELCAIWFANKVTFTDKIKEWGYESVAAFCGITPRSLSDKLRPYANTIVELIEKHGVVGAVATWNANTDLSFIWTANRNGIRKLAKIYGWQPTNHKVVGIELLNELHDTFCVEVEGTHNFLLANGVLTHNSDGTGPTIETLPGAENLDAIADIEYFKKNMIAPMKIPFSRVGIGEAAGAPSEKSLSAVHPEFAKSVQWVQREASAGLTKVAIVHLALRGYSVDDLRGFELSLPSTSAIEELYRITTWQTRVQVMSDLKDLAWFPKQWIVTHFTDLTPDEIQELKQMEELASDGGDEGVGGEGGGGNLGGLGGGGDIGDLGGLGGGGELGGGGGEELGGGEGLGGGDEGGGEAGGEPLGGGDDDLGEGGLGEQYDSEAAKRVLTELRRRGREAQAMELVKKWARKRGTNETHDGEIANSFKFMLESKELDGLSASDPKDTAKAMTDGPTTISECKVKFTTLPYSADDPNLLVEWSVPEEDRNSAISDTLMILAADIPAIPGDDSEITRDDLPS